MATRRKKKASKAKGRKKLKKKRRRGSHPGWGGARPGAGRKPKGDKAGVSHLQRETVTAKTPVLIKARLKPRLPSMRSKAAFASIRQTLEDGSQRPGFRIVHYSIQKRHLQLILEAQNRKVMARNLQGFFVRLARGLNRVWDNEGSIFADRYESKVLASPKEVRAALLGVLNDWRRQGRQPAGKPDPCSSGAWFDGWRERDRARAAAARAKLGDPVCPEPRSDLLRKSWKRLRAIGLDESPPVSPKKAVSRSRSRKAR